MMRDQLRYTGYRCGTGRCVLSRLSSPLPSVHPMRYRMGRDRPWSHALSAGGLHRAGDCQMDVSRAGCGTASGKYCSQRVRPDSEPCSVTCPTAGSAAQLLCRLGHDNALSRSEAVGLDDARTCELTLLQIIM